MFAIVGILTCTTIATAGAQTLSEADIEAAIKAGLETKETGLVFVDAVLLRNNPIRPDKPIVVDIALFSASIAGPLTTIQMFAAHAAKNYTPFTRADVIDEMLAPVVYITVHPDKPTFSTYGGWSIAPHAKRVVLQPTGTTTIIQPTRMKLLPVQWSNAAGGKFEGQGIEATFKLEDIPTTDFDIIIVGGVEETRITVKAPDRAKVR